MKIHRVLGIAGSLRAKSINRALLQAACDLAPENMSIESFSIGEIPLYNGDLDGETPPLAVAQLRRAITASDAVLLVTPEFNHGIPGILKNAIDWASQPAFNSPFAQKPIGMMTATPGPVGGARAQIELVFTLHGLAAIPLPHPGFCLGLAKSKFDASLQLVDAGTRTFVTRYLTNTGSFIERLQPPD